jgi:hypothetical protein
VVGAGAAATLVAERPHHHLHDTGRGFTSDTASSRYPWKRQSQQETKDR